MRVLHLTTEFPPIIYGGLGTATGGLVKALVRAGIDVAVFLFGPSAGSRYGEFRPLSADGAAVRRRRATGVTIFEISWFRDLDAVARIAARWRPDVLHLHSFWMWPIAQALRPRLGTPLVYTVHSLDRAEYEIGAGPPQCIGQWSQQESVIHGADRIICLTASERDLLIDYCPGVDDRIRVVGNGIEDVSTAPRAGGRHRGAPIVLFSGRFVDRKGIRELIDAIGIVLAEAPQVRFVLAGGHRDCTGAQMESWLLPDHLRRYRSQIHFTGWLAPDRVAEWYRTADILVVPSWYEPFGMVVLEGMIHGLAVAASAVGGPAEILRDGMTGVLFPPGDAQALARSILRLVDNPALRARIADAGAEDVRKKWLWPRIVEKMRDTYEDVVHGEFARQRPDKDSTN
jgi:glycosyltransferase involved in cell wall biosynthesis